MFAADKNIATTDLILVNAKVTTVDHENLEAQVIDAGSRTCASCD
ncbi:hypothetical protein [uncultured Sphingomonas sp.]|nr:hypothetical protein [uncultured Sphingomonas sp.]